MRSRFFTLLILGYMIVCISMAGAEGDRVGQFDFETKTVLLNSGYEMPILGLGTYALDHDTCVNSVKTLLASGGRLIDTAYMYGNEDAVGEGVRQAMADKVDEICAKYGLQVIGKPWHEHVDSTEFLTLLGVDHILLFHITCRLEA